MVKPVQDNLNKLEKISIVLTHWVGTPLSVLIHTILFIGIFTLKWVGFTIDNILLILTTAVSLEAIYLAIFIQMTVNRSAASLESVRGGVEDIQEDVEGLESDIEDISEDIDVIQTEHEEEDEDDHSRANNTLGQIETQLQKVINELEQLKKANTLRGN